VPADRQLTDAQIRKLLDRDAVIGTAMDAWMLHPKWIRQVTNPSELSLSAAVDHIDHVCQLAGDARHVGLGSDLDGGYGNEQTARELRSYGDLHRLTDLLSRRGFSDDDVAAYFHGNWLRKMRQFLSS
jgi:membrane dipeptidase